MKIIGNTVYNYEAVPASKSWEPMLLTKPVAAGAVHSAYRAPGAKGLGELTYSGYSRLHSRIMRGIFKNALLSLLFIAALLAVAVVSFLAKFDGGYSDALLVIAVPLICLAAIAFIAIGAVNDTRSDLARLRRGKKRLSRSAAARIERESGRRRRSALIALAVSAALLIALNAVALA